MNVVTRTVLQELRRRLGSILGILLGTFGLIAFETFAPWPFKVLIDNVLGHEALHIAGPFESFFASFHGREALGLFVVLLFCVSSLLVTVMEYAVNLSSKRLGQELIRSFSIKAFQQVEQLAVGYFRQQEIGDYVYRLSYDVSAISDWLSNGLLPLIINIGYLGITLVIIFFINAELAGLSLLMLPFLAAGLWIFNRQIGRASQRSERANSSLFAFIQEALSQLRIIQAFNQQQPELERFTREETASLQEELTVNGLNFLLNLTIGAVIAVGYAGVIAVGIQAVFAGELSTGLLVVFIFYLDNLTNPLLSIIGAASLMRETGARLMHLNDFFSRRFHVRDPGKRPAPASFGIEFDNVTVLGDEGKPILQNVSCVIPAGKTTVIVGISGSGKTTLLSLIMRFIEADRGRIRVNGVDIRRHAIAPWRASIAYVPQEVMLFHGSIADNIAFGTPNPDAYGLRRAARLAAAEHFIQGLPHGYQFQVGEGGANLSGGQRQRLMLARAFLKRDAGLLVLDEPYSSLDIKTRTQISESLHRATHGKTSIIVSNVLDAVRHADHVIVLSEGRVLRSGHADSLLKETHLTDILLNTM